MSDKNARFIRVAFVVSVIGTSFLGCRSRSLDSQPKAHPVDRKILGVGKPYLPDKDISLLKLRSSMVLRRKEAWEVVRRILRSVPTAESPANIPNGAREVPLWQTWYDSKEFRTIFDDLYDGLGPDGRVQYDGARPKVENGRLLGSDFCPSEVAAAFQRNLESGASQFDTASFLQRLNRFRTTQQMAGLSGTGKTLFSPAVIQHYLMQYRRIAYCDRLIKSLKRDEPAPFTGKSHCMEPDFPSGKRPLYEGVNYLYPKGCDVSKADDSESTYGSAVAIKTAWQLVEANQQIGVFQTDGEGIMGTLNRGYWQPKGLVDTMTLSASSIYTIETVPIGSETASSTLALTGMHITSKEFPDWLWISLWWSDDPNSDFGSDRPQDGVFDKQSPWSHYKMCVVVDYDEGDTPSWGQRGIVEGVRQTTKAVEPHTWCSNPFIEHGRGNARTNCIGCHQHAGAGVNADEVFLDDPFDISNDVRRAKFPHGSRSKVRMNFPGDYLWSFSDDPDYFQTKIVQTIDSFQ